MEKELFSSGTPKSDLKGKVYDEVVYRDPRNLFDGVTPSTLGEKSDLESVVL